MKTETLLLLGGLLYLFYKNQQPSAPLPSGVAIPGASYLPCSDPNANPQYCNSGYTGFVGPFVGPTQSGVVSQTQPGGAQAIAEQQPGYSNNPTFPDNQYY
jgi:hypothetical protein